MSSPARALLRTVSSRLEASTVINTLRLAQIECTAVDASRTGLVGYGQAPVLGGIELYVDEGSLEAAKEAIGAAGVGANDVLGFYDASSGLPQCPEHDAPFDLPCARCGTFICARCVGAGEHLCAACELRAAAQPRPRPVRRLATWVVRAILFAFFVTALLAFLGNLLAGFRRGLR